MDLASVRKWIVFFLGILGAVLIADTLSNIIIILAGVTGWVKFVSSFVLYAVFFFGVLYLLEKYCHIDFFGFYHD
jgi:hypothetical protein